MQSKKIYGNAIYVNNEKVVLSKKAIEILSYNSDVFDGSFSGKIISALELISNSKDDIEIVKAAEKTEIIEINRTVKGFHFEGFAVISDGICYMMYVERDGRSMYFKGEKAQQMYNQLINN